MNNFYTDWLCLDHPTPVHRLMVVYILWALLTLPRPRPVSLCSLGDKGSWVQIPPPRPNRTPTNSGFLRFAALLQSHVANGWLLRRIAAVAEIRLGGSWRCLLSSMLLRLRCRPTVRAHAVTVTNTRRFRDARGARRFRNGRCARKAARWIFRANRPSRQLIVRDRRRVLFQRRLLLQERVQLVLDPLLLKQLLVRGAVELCAQVSNSPLIARLHSSHQLGVVFAQPKISGCCDRPNGRDDQHGPDNWPAKARPLRWARRAAWLTTACYRRGHRRSLPVRPSQAASKPDVQSDYPIRQRPTAGRCG